MKIKKDKTYNLSRSVPTVAPLEPNINKGWKPIENGDHITHTMPFGGSLPTQVDANPPKKEG